MVMLTPRLSILAGVASALVGTFAFFILPYLQSSTHCYAGITAVGSVKEINCFTVSYSGTFSRLFHSSRTKNIDKGFVIPGLWDGHGHLLQYGEFLSGVDLFGATSLDDARSKVQQYISLNPGVGTSQNWIRGVGWDQAAFDGRMPTAADLEVNLDIRGKYIILDRVDVHCIWVSQAVLGLLPNPLPASPDGGEIVTDPGPGVFCDNAMDLVLKHYPKPDEAQKMAFVKAAMKELNSVGLVGMHDAGTVPEDLRMFDKLSKTEDWTVRVYAMLECEKRNTFCPQQAVKFNNSNGMFTVRSVKLFADGALGSWGSALLEPYSDKPAVSGSLLVNGSTLTHLAESWASEGYQVNIHAIGDRANRLTIDALTSALKVRCPSESLSECQEKARFRIEHSQIIHPNDQNRMHSVGIIPSIQPTHATSDMSYAEDRLGHERTSQEAYRMRSLLPLHPILGSDFPVEPPNPFHGMYAAVARKSPRTGRNSTGGSDSWYAAESLSLEEALSGFTIAPARGAFLEGRAGVIQEGAFADWIVLDEPLGQLDIESLRHVKVRETWVGGRMVFRRGGWEASASHNHYSEPVRSLREE